MRKFSQITTCQLLEICLLFQHNSVQKWQSFLRRPTEDRAKTEVNMEVLLLLCNMYIICTKVSMCGCVFITRHQTPTPWLDVADRVTYKLGVVMHRRRHNRLRSTGGTLSTVAHRSLMLLAGSISGRPHSK